MNSTFTLGDFKLITTNSSELFVQMGKTRRFCCLFPND